MLNPLKDLLILYHNTRMVKKDIQIESYMQDPITTQQHFTKKLAKTFFSCS